MLVAALWMWAGGMSVAWGGQSVSSAILERLASEDYQTRETATRELLEETEPDLDALGRLYHQATLAEQRHRLRSVIEHHVMVKIIDQRFPRPAPGAIGLRPVEVPAGNLPGLGRRAIRVESTIVGFPGYVHLRPGDLIVAIDGRKVVAPPDQSLALRFTTMIQGRQAGDFITLKLIRDGKTITVRFRLSNSNALRQIHGGMAVPFNTQALVFAQRRRELMRLIGDDQATVTRFKLDLPKPGDEDAQGQNNDQQGMGPPGFRPFGQGVFAVEPPDPQANPQQVLDRIDQLLKEIEDLRLAPDDLGGGK